MARLRIKTTINHRVQVICPKYAHTSIGVLCETIRIHDIRDVSKDMCL